MPQMAPIMWSYLFIFFIATLMLFLMMNYFMNIYYPKFKMNSNQKIYKLWKL